MRGFILANLFLVAVVLIAAVLCFVGGFVFSAIGNADTSSSVWLAAITAALVIVGIFFVTRWLHRFLERRVNRAR
jgi:small-conductance mechanosensitive channel